MRVLDLSLAPIESALNSKQLGIPVAVRVIAHLKGAPKAAALERWAEEHAARWLNSPAVRCERLSTVGAEHQTSLVAYAGGQTALLSTGSASAGSELLQVTVFGSRGVMNYSGPTRSLDVLEVPSIPSPAPVRPPQEPPFGVLLAAGHETHQPMYAAAFQADPRCRLVGVTDEAQIAPRRRARNAQLAAELGIPLLEDYPLALTRPDVQVVSMCAEPERRGRMIVQAARAGKHLYLDKPLAGDAQTPGQIVREVRRGGILAHMFSSLTASPISRLRGLLRSAELGTLLAVHADLCFAKGEAGTAELKRPREESFPPEKFEVADAKRELTNIGVYPLTLLTALLGGRPRELSATTGNYFFAEHQAAGMEDFGQIVLRWEHGLLATCSAGRTGWHSHPAEGLNRIALIGSKRAIVLEAHQPRAELWTDHTPWQPPPRNPDDPMGMWLAPPDSPYRPAPKQAWFSAAPLDPAADVAYFLDCLESGRDSEVDAATAAAASEILLAAYQSAAERRPVSL